MKRVLITGVSRGLGRATAEVFAAAGWETTGLARSHCSIPGVATHQVDVCDEEAVTALIASLPPTDVVVNNAGIARYRPLLETPTQELEEILAVNVVAAFVVMREAARRMRETGGGLIINIASDAATRGIAQMAPYVASKHALLGLGRSVALEMKPHGVRVCTYCPGPISTDILGPGSCNPKALQPADIARTLLHLAELPPSMAAQEILVTPQSG